MKLTKIALCTSFLFFLGCKKDKELNQTVEGDWQYQRLVVYSGKDGKELSRTEGDDCERKIYKKFRPDGTMEDQGFTMINSICESTGYGPNHYRFEPETKKLFTWFLTDGRVSPSDTYIVHIPSAQQLGLQWNEKDVDGDGIADAYVDIYHRN